MGAQEDIEQHLAAALNIVEAAKRIEGVCVGQLIGFKESTIPLVVFPQMPGTAAIVARTTIDLHAEHIGSEIVLQFENGDPQLPIVMGLLRQPSAWPLNEQPAQVSVDADGERLLVDAKQEIVLRCGKASITLTKAGKILIRGTFISSRSSGANRIKGGSVLIN